MVSDELSCICATVVRWFALLHVATTCYDVRPIIWAGSPLTLLWAWPDSKTSHSTKEEMSSSQASLFKEGFFLGWKIVTGDHGICCDAWKRDL